MAIDRAPWNALVDDDGSNLVGTIWNKDKIKTVILDPTDAAIAAVVPPTPPPAYAATILRTTATGVVADWNPGIVGNTIIYCENTAGLLQITGLASTPAAIPGQRVRLVRMGSQDVVIFFYHAASLTTNRFVFPAPTPRSLTAAWASLEFQYGETEWVLSSFET